MRKKLRRERKLRKMQSLASKKRRVHELPNGSIGFDTMVD